MSTAIVGIVAFAAGWIVGARWVSRRVLREIRETFAAAPPVGHMDQKRAGET